MDRKSDNHIEVHFHAERFSRVNGEWYYSTREQENVGPFPARESAQEDLVLYLAKIGQSPEKNEPQRLCN